MMPGKLNLRLNNQEGTTAVEFAIILWLLLLFVFGIIEFSLFLYNKQVITNAAREGARRGVIVRAPIRIVEDGTYGDGGPFKLGEDNQIRARIEEFAGSHLVTFGDDTFDAFDPEDVIITRDYTDDKPFEFENDLIVEVNFSYDFLFLKTINLGPINLQSVATMKME